MDTETTTPPINRENIETRRLLALDLSPTNSGVARVSRWCAGQPVIETERVEVPNLRVPGKRPGTMRNENRRGAMRLQWWEDWLIEEIADGLDLLALEGYSFGSHDQGQREKCELYGVVRLRCLRRGVPLVQVPPKTIKKFATGNGNAKKEAMFAPAVERFGEQIRTEDEADAAWLALYVLENHL